MAKNSSVIVIIGDIDAEWLRKTYDAKKEDGSIDDVSLVVSSTSSTSSSSSSTLSATFPEATSTDNVGALIQRVVAADDNIMIIIEDATSYVEKHEMQIHALVRQCARAASSNTPGSKNSTPLLFGTAATSKAAAASKTKEVDVNNLVNAKPSPCLVLLFPLRKLQSFHLPGSVAQHVDEYIIRPSALASASSRDVRHLYHTVFARTRVAPSASEFVTKVLDSQDSQHSQDALSCGIVVTPHQWPPYMKKL